MIQNIQHMNIQHIDIQHMDPSIESVLKEFYDAYNLTSQYKNMEWSIGVVLQNNQTWYLKIIHRQYVMELINEWEATSSNGTFKELLSLYMYNSKNIIRNIYYKARIWGDDDVAVFDTTTHKIHEAIKSMQESQGFELEFKRKTKSYRY